MQIQSMHRLLRNGIVGCPSKAREIPAPPPILPTSSDATSNMYVVHEAVQFHSPLPVPMTMPAGCPKRPREETEIENAAWAKFTNAHGNKCLRCTTSLLAPRDIVDQLTTLSEPYRELWTKDRRGAGGRVRSKKQRLSSKQCSCSTDI
jgi:hypothetical protein